MKHRALAYFSLLAPIMIFGGCVTTIATLKQQQGLESIKEFPGLSKKELYNRSLSWVARTYNSANNVIQLKNQEAGQIICKGIGSIFDILYRRHFGYTMIIDIKNGKIRTRYESIYSKQIGDVAGPDMKRQWKKVERHLRQHSEDLFASILIAEKEEDW